jgi:hypothetical protein
MTSKDDSKKKIENFETEIPWKLIFAFLTFIVIVGGGIYEKFFSSKNPIKSLTSSTSPSFNLTHTPNIK